MNYEPNNIMHYIFKQRRWSSSRFKLLNTSKNYKLDSQRHNLDIEEEVYQDEKGQIYSKPQNIDIISGSEPQLTANDILCIIL
jgi:hypothetical protein